MWGMVKKLKFWMPMGKQNMFCNINWQIPWTILKEKINTTNAKHAPVGYSKYILYIYIYIYIYIYQQSKGHW